MSRSYSTTLLAAVVLSTSLSTAQTARDLDVTNARPLLVIARELSDKYGWVVSYEDAPVVSHQHLMRENDEMGRTWIFPRPARVFVTAEDVTLMDSAARSRLIRHAINQYNRPGAPARYGFAISDDIVRIYPVQVMSGGGELAEFTPLLDTPISLPPRKYQVGEVVSAVLTEIQRFRGAQISIGSIPPNLLPIEITEGASHETAYTVLDRALDAVNGRRLLRGDDRLVFRTELVYLPGNDSYFYNVSVAKRVPAAPIADDSNPPVTSTGSRGGGKVGRE